jgi:hypothetical protein
MMLDLSEARVVSAVGIQRLYGAMNLSGAVRQTDEPAQHPHDRPQQGRM